MRIDLHIGLQHVGADRLQNVLAEKREQLISKDVLFARSPGNKNHTRLFMAVTNPDHVDPLRYNRGYITAEKQAVLRDALIKDLTREVAQHKPKVLILSCAQLGTSLAYKSELERLKSLLTPLSKNIRIVAHVDEQSKLLARHYAAQIFEGRGVSLDLEMGVAEKGNWWSECLKATPPIDAAAGMFEETQGPPFWMDYAALVDHWQSVFGSESMVLHPYNASLFASKDVTKELCAVFQIRGTIGKTSPAGPDAQPSVATLTRGRMLNALLLKVLANGTRVLPRQLWRSLVTEVTIEGPALNHSDLSVIATAFTKGNKAVVACQPALCLGDLTPPVSKGQWHEADPEFGFRPSQYLLSFLWRIDKATLEEAANKPNDAHTPTGIDDGLSTLAQSLLPPVAKQNYHKLKTSRMAPHNKLGSVNEEETAAAYTPIAPRKLPKGSSGNVIVGCMKNEAPYIVEWIAYHRAIGVDNFLIYTNDCSDGTTEILDRLQAMGIVQHRNNDKWRGKSPQQHALNQSLKEPIIKNAGWIAHIDVDEFMNVRTGNGTLQDFFDAVPDATNVAMTWRLFGHNGVTQLSDNFVIDQFDTCAPKYCPKPHTVWGFKTMFKNIGAYQKISCHRPNKLIEDRKFAVKWVNGSGADITAESAEKGWRSSTKSIGYDLLQLNHYALRSAESFLIKRQRGRALHVDRSIGINYWIRMDWSDFKDITIKRNTPRLRTEYDTLMQDKALRNWHEKGLIWHRNKALELHGMPEFQDLYDQALKIKLNETERVAYALALDMES